MLTDSGVFRVKQGHDNLYSGVIVTQLLRDRFTLVINHGQHECGVMSGGRGTEVILSQVKAV